MYTVTLTTEKVIEELVTIKPRSRSKAIQETFRLIDQYDIFEKLGIKLEISNIVMAIYDQYHSSWYI